MRNLIRRTDRISKAPEQNRQQDSGGSMMRDMITENISRDAVPQGIMDNPIVGTIMEGYDKIEPYIPEKIDTTPGISGDFYGYEAPVGPGTITFGADRGLDNFYGGYKFSFDEGGIVDTPQMQEMMKKELTDEQKDYLYDFMLDFMFKQKQKEQQEMEGNMPRFNYFDMEV
jgi:hypothetical protein